MVRYANWFSLRQRFLIGPQAAHDDLNAAVRRVLFGENKVCGLTRARDAKSGLQTLALNIWRVDFCALISTRGER